MDNRQILIFRLFSIYVFIVQKGIFFLLEYRKTNFPGLFCQNKNIEKVPIFDKNHGLTPFEKNLAVGTFSTPFFYSLKRRFFFLE